MKWISRKWLIGIGILILIILIWLVFRQTPVTVEIGVVKRGEMIVTIDGEGKTRVREKFTVTAPISGKMSRINLHQGDSIFKDFVITRIDPSPPERPLTPSQMENFPDIYGIKVYSPVNGTVLHVIEENERMIQAGTPILEIGNPENLEIVVDILSTEATQIKPGATMLIENWGSANTLSARVRTIEPQAFTKISALGVEEQRVNIIADLQDKIVKLGDNYRLDTRIIAWQSADVLKVNSSALFREGEKWKVFVNKGGTARLRDVEIRHQTASETEILSGLSEGETVILHPSNQIADGIRVQSQ
jgi:multidrug efflux pump subunit AcrA (membrane-fusion protein)